jgi:hypothetical protein
LTARDDDFLVWKAILPVSAASLVLAATGSGATMSALAAGPGLPAGWTHAAINFYVNHTAHTLVLDRGRVTTASGTSLTLVEQDGVSVQVTLALTTQVIVDGQPGQISDIRRGVTAMTQTIDGGPARLVRVHVPPRLARLTRR